ncbi:hypothetical protein CRUP_036271 [Coryphaenoides rupestris]|nr:hypothetical protein CRUP_036271 [Coryphaenoides rupestris]
MLSLSLDLVCRYCFPFGRPDGALKATLSLQERVCLQKAAHINYCELLQFAQIHEDAEVSREKRLEDLMRLGELCLEVLQQNQEHHSESWEFDCVYMSA